MFADLREATRSVSKIAILQRDLYLHEAEVQTIRQARRVARGVAGLLLIQLALGLGLLWIGVILYQRGWSPAWIAGLSFLLPLLAAAVFWRAE